LIAESWADRWLTGLGCLAIPAAQLRALAEQSPTFFPAPGAEAASLFVMPHLHPAPGSDALYWRAEDFALCLRLGGVALAELAVGHLKKGRVIYPLRQQRTDTNG
jgi:hypothetical protein